MLPTERFYEVEHREVFPLLDKYKKAWTTMHDAQKVAELKEELRKKVETEHGAEFPTMVEAFLNQCWQIEQRWARPNERDHSVH